MVGPIFHYSISSTASAEITQLADTKEYTDPDPDDPSKYINFHAFVANIKEFHVFPTSPTWAI